MYAIAVCTLYYRELTFKGLLAVSARAARTTSVVMLIVATATAVGWFITSAQIPMQVAELFQPLVDSPILLLLSINVFLFLAGMVMDLTPNVLIFAPVFYPLIQQAGIDPYFFGLLFILNLGIGVITPPVGTVLYVVCGIGNIKIEHGSLPYRGNAGAVPASVLPLAVHRTHEVPHEVAPGNQVTKGRACGSALFLYVGEGSGRAGEAVRREFLPCGRRELFGDGGRGVGFRAWPHEGVFGAWGGER